MFKQFTRKPGEEITHVLMDGGILSVPFDKMEEFYSIYIHSVKTNQKVYVVEQKTKLYNFFVDVDYIVDEALTSDNIVSIASAICDKVSVFSPGTPALVSVSEPKNKNGKIKTGIHINWPGLVVDQTNAMALMEHIIQHLSSVDPSKEWTKYIDQSVYKGSGFRLPWSHKKAKHEQCDGKGCSECQKGKITEGMYLPILFNSECITQDITLEKLQWATVRSQAKQCSVYIPPTSTDFVGTSIKTTHIDILQEFIQKNIEGQSKAKVLKVTKGKKSMYSYAVSTDTRYCANKKAQHNSNHVWFEVNSKERTICQRCHDDQCEKYTGRKHRVPDKICEIMFGSTCNKSVLDNVYLHTVPHSRPPRALCSLFTS